MATNSNNPLQIESIKGIPSEDSTMSVGNVRCERNCGNSIKRELAEKHSGWAKTEDGEWLCTACNPDSNVSWAQDSEE